MRDVLMALLVGLSVVPATAAPRIITLAPHLAELVCAAGACAQLVGVADFTDEPRTATLPRIGNAHAVNTERVLALRPDWVLFWDGGMSPDIARRLISMGLRVDRLAVRGLDDIPVAIERIGRQAGTTGVAQAAARAYRQRLAALRRQYADRPLLRVFYQIETAPAYTINRHSPIHEALALCGGRNLFADLPVIAGAVNDEAVIAARPEVVVTTDFEDVAALDVYWARFPNLPAAQHRVVVSANAITRQSPRVLDGVEQLCRGLDRVRLTHDARSPQRRASVPAGAP